LRDPVVGRAFNELELLRESKRCAQNIGTSGSEIRKPPREKILATQRTAALFIPGTNRRTSAPGAA